MSIFLEYFYSFPSLLVCVDLLLRGKSPLGSIYIGHVFFSFFFLSYTSATLSLLIEAFNPFTFKVIIYRNLFLLFSTLFLSSTPLSSSSQSSPSSISCNAGLVEMYSFSFFFFFWSGKFLILPSILNVSLVG